MTSIDKAIPIPLYYQLKQLLLERIDQGIYPKGEPIASEFEMMEEFGLSRTTVRQAIGELVNEGVLERHKGVGTFVAARPMPTATGRINMSLNAGHVGGTCTRVAFGTQPADAAIAERLELAAGDPVYVLDRLRWVDKKPLAFSRSYAPARLFPTMPQDQDEVTAGLYKYIDKAGYCITEVHQRMEVGSSDRKASRLLGIPTGSTVWIVKELALAESLPVEYSIAVILPYQGLCFEVISTREEFEGGVRDNLSALRPL